jgi:cell division septation protein DedD
MEEMTPETQSEQVESASVKTPTPEPAAASGDAAEKPKTDPWKTAFIVLLGIVGLSAVLIYSTSVKQTDPTTVLQPDVNGQPVQPLNPASGVEEERLAAMPADAVVSNSNANIATLPGGDGYDPWANGGKPPAGGPPIGPGGGFVTVPNTGSQFMPPDCILQPSGIYLCPQPVNANAAVKPTPTPKPTPQSANIQPSPTPATNATPKSSPTPAAPKPTPAPRAKPAASKTPD